MLEKEKIKEKIEKYAPYGVWAFFAYFCFRYAIEILNGGNSWKTGDWLINYSAGFVRRGLTGSFFLTISDFGLPLLWLTYFTQITIYAVIFGLVLKLYKRTKRTLFWLLILFSPGFLLFSFYDIKGGFRKEILVFAVFTFFCFIYTNKSVTHIKLLFISVLYSIAALSHELTVFTLPFFFYLLYLSAKESLVRIRTAVVYSLILTIVSTVILFFVFLNKGDEFLAQAICQSLMDRNLDRKICVGAISWLSEDFSHAQSRVTKELVGYKYIFNTAVLLGLALLPLSFTTYWNKERVFFFMAGLATIFPLFLFAIDWGRWIYIVIFMFYVLVLASDVTIKYTYRHIFVVAGLIYLTTWSIRHCCSAEFGTGFIGVAKHYSVWILKKLGTL